MALLTAVSISYRGVLSVGLFATINSEGGLGWEAVTDAGGLLPNLAGDVDNQGLREFFRRNIPFPEGGDQPAGIDLAAAYDASGGAGTEHWHSNILNVPVMQMLAGDVASYIFFIEYGRAHSVPR
jgi:hypothetical protein